MTNPSYKAMMFARELHQFQKRKYTGNPYVDHLQRVKALREMSDKDFFDLIGNK